MGLNVMLEEDHVSICKPHDKTSLIYQYICIALQSRLNECKTTGIAEDARKSNIPNPMV